jgi:hypothetical protein
VYLISDKDNRMTESNRDDQFQLHIQPGEMVEVIGTDGDTVAFIYSDGNVYAGNGKAVITA